MTEIEFTRTEAGRWHETIVPMDADRLAEALSAWADHREQERTPGRRVRVHTDSLTGKRLVVRAAAIRLPDGRVFDAVLGAFRNPEPAP